MKNCSRCLLLLTLFFVPPVFSQTATPPSNVGEGGVGTASNPYKIESLENLYWIFASNAVVTSPTQAERCAAYYIQTANINAAATGKGGDWGTEGWTPIGNWPTYFGGEYNGNNHTIDSLYINRAAVDEQGLFGRVYSTTGIHSLGVTNANITASGLVGAVVGNLLSGTVDSCYSTGSVTGSNCYVGGLVGYSGDATIRHSYSTCSVTCTGGYYVAGLVGYASNTILENSHSTGNVNGNNNLGGLVGGFKNGSSMSYCYSSDTIVGTSSNIGGLAGEVENSTIMYSYSGCTVSGASYAGGLVGYIYLGTISNCYNRSTVSCEYDCGGLVGDLETSTVSFCYSTGSVNSSSDAGGLIGFTWDSQVDKSFWDTQTSGQSTSAGGTGKTTAEMKTQSTFTDSSWNFTTVWEITSGQYPTLQGVSDVALPVELASFTATAKHNSVELKWNTATEINNSGFEIEKQTTPFFPPIQEGDIRGGWTKIGFVEGSGTTNSPTSYSFVDRTANGKNAYRLKQIDRDGKFKYSQEVEVNVGYAPKEFSLNQNYPNPFNPTTMISYQLPVSNHVTLKVYDALGREAATLVNDVKKAGNHSVTFDASKFSSGIYLCTIKAGNSSATKKLTLLK
ncbi:MAG: T9SS type A sorting domain-containing protein [Bacteroidetes bacterium]|nr:T9SS type A sorting domain-containing protein [Bacteroidota bacterium]